MENSHTHGQGQGEATTTFELSKQVESLNSQLAALQKESRKNKQRDNLNRNLLSHFGKEMWVYAIIVSVVCGFALGVFLVNVRLANQACEATGEVTIEFLR